MREHILQGRVQAGEQATSVPTAWGPFLERALYLSVGIAILSAVLAFAIEPGRFNPMVMLLGFLVAFVVFGAARYQPSGPGSLLGELKQLREEVNGLRRALETARCSTCGAPVPPGSNFCPNCGASTRREGEALWKSGTQGGLHQGP